jgi:5-methylcytosine-specific restriction endonuclease McrA
MEAISAIGRYLFSVLRCVQHLIKLRMIPRATTMNSKTKVAIICPTCGKEFIRKRKAQRYCSVKCSPGRARKPENYTTKECPVCGKEFTYHNSWPANTCSIKCRNRLNHPDAKATTKCPECGKEFAYYKSRPGGRKYCSRACAAKNAISNIPHWKPSAYETTCEQCGKKYSTTPASTRGRFCSRECFGDWMKEHAPSGPDNPKYGKKYGRPSHLPPLPTKICPVCNKEFSVKPSHFDRRVTCSKSCMAIYYVDQQTGENNFNWKGGYTPYYGPNWRQQRRTVRHRDNYTCQRCGITENELGKQLDVHHIRRFGDFSDYREANKSKNLICYCPTCHLIVEHETNGR